jgi:uncharacterized protein
MNPGMETLSFRPEQAHVVDVDGHSVLFHVPTTSLFELDRVGAEVLDLFRQQPHVSAKDIQARFDGLFPASQVAETLQEFRDLGILGDGSPCSPPPRTGIKIQEYPLSTIVLNVNTGCNLSCSYCYKEDLETPAKGQRMSLETAVRSIELLLREGHTRERVNVVFFGGEPLSNLALIKEVVSYAERRCAEEGKKVDFSLTTNATLLREQIVDYLDEHRFGISISMDGPAAVHDRHRRTVGGKGTYDVVAGKARMLLARYRSRPVGARVTITSGCTDVVAIHRHLVSELGFHEVGFAPVTTHAVHTFNLDAEELKVLFEGMKTLGNNYLEAALSGENTGFSNMHQLMTDLHEGTRKSLPCGAGVGLLAVDKEGDLNLCHRFTGSELPTYGNVVQGIDKTSLGRFLEAVTERSGTVCATCRIRNLCAGGCYHESYAKFTDPLSPTYHYCDLMRDWVEFGVGVYVRILQNNPEFFPRHIAPRRAVER